MKFRDIPQFPTAHYSVDVGWDYLEDHLQNWAERANGQFGGLDLDPPFQRAHVWKPAQQIAYVEYMLQGGEVSRQITFNSPDWGSSYRAPTVLVDGKQRLEAVRAFMGGKIRAFGKLVSDFEGRIPQHIRFQFRVCMLQTEAELLNLYLNINAGGTPHTRAELNKVRTMLEKL